MLDKIPQRDTEIIEQLAFSYAESVQEAARNTLATIYKKGVIAERKAVIDKILGIIEINQDGDDIKNEFDSGYVSACKNIRAAVEALKGGEPLQKTQRLEGETW